MKPRNLTKHALSMLILFSILAVVIASCAPAPATTAPQPETKPVSPATAEKVKIRVMGNDAYARIWQDKFVPEFQKKYPNVDVEVVGVPYADLLPKEMLEITSKPSNFDVIVTDDPWTPQLAETGLLADLKKDVAQYTDANYDWSDIHPAPLAAGQWKGIQYGVPCGSSNLLLMFYNKQLFKDAGVPVPDANTTWDQFMAMLPKLVRDTNSDGKPDTWAIATYWLRDQLTPTIWQAILNSNGGQVLDQDLKPAFNTAAGAAALKMHMDMAKFGPPGAESYGFNETLEAFRQSKVAVMFNWGSVYGGVAVTPETTKLTPDIVGVMPMPRGSQFGSSHRGIWIATVAKNSTHLKEAWYFVQWMSSKEGEQVQVASGRFPARKSTLTMANPPQPWMGPLFKSILDGYDIIEKGQMWRPRLPDSDAVQRILALYHSKAMAGELTPEKALDGASKEITDLLTTKGYYKK